MSVSEAVPVGVFRMAGEDKLSGTGANILSIVGAGDAIEYPQVLGASFSGVVPSLGEI